MTVFEIVCRRICRGVKANFTHFYFANRRVWSEEKGDFGFSDWL
jgi:hypothetical protein